MKGKKEEKERNQSEHQMRYIDYVMLLAVRSVCLAVIDICLELR